MTTRTFEHGKDAVAALARHFANNRALYHKANYKEAHARQEFIDPFFAALGWAAKDAGEKQRLQRLSEATDHQIGALVLQPRVVQQPADKTTWNMRS